MAKPIDLDESFVDIRSGISIDPILVEEARSIKNSLEPEAKICDNEIIGQIRLRDKVNDIWTNIEDPCVFLPIQHTDSTEGLLPTKDPNEFLRDTELCVASKTVESCALHTIYKKGKLENPSCAPNMLLDCGPTFGPFERKRMHFQDRACIFSELYQCLRYQSFAERQESRNERSISDILLPCSGTKMEGRKKIERDKDHYKRSWQRKRPLLLVFCLYLSPLILANVTECSLIDQELEERIVLVCMKNAASNYSCEVTKKIHSDLNELNGIFRDTEVVQDSCDPGKRGALCPKGQVYHCIKDVHSRKLVKGCAKPTLCTKGSFPQLYTYEKKQAFVQCVVCDQDHYQPYLIESFNTTGELVLPRIPMEMRKEHDKMVLVKSHWPYGPDEYACDTKKGYSNLLGKHLCDVASPCKCTRSIKCSSIHGLELLPDGNCDKICIGERDPLNQFKCKGLLPEMEGTIAHIFVLVSISMVFVSVLFGVEGSRIKYIKQSLKIRNAIEDEAVNKYSNGKIKKDTCITDDTENCVQNIQYTCKDKSDIVQDKEDFCRSSEKESSNIVTNYMTENKTSEEDDFQDSGVDVNNTDLDCAMYKEEIKQKSDEDTIINDKEKCEYKNTTEEEKIVEPQDVDDLDSAIENCSIENRFSITKAMDKEEKSLEDEGFVSQPIQESITDFNKVSQFEKEGFCRSTRGLYKSLNEAIWDRSHMMSLSHEVNEAEHMKPNDKICCVCHYTCTLLQQDRCRDEEMDETISYSQRLSNEWMYQKNGENLDSSRLSNGENCVDNDSKFVSKVTLTDRSYKETDLDNIGISKDTPDHQITFPMSLRPLNGDSYDPCEQRDDNPSLRSDALFDCEEGYYTNQDGDGIINQLAEPVLMRLSEHDSCTVDSDDNNKTQMVSLKTLDEISEKMKTLVRNSNEACKKVGMKVENREYVSDRTNETYLHLDWPDSSTEALHLYDHLTKCEQTDFNSVLESETVEEEIKQQKKESACKPKDYLSLITSYSSGYPIHENDCSEYGQSTDSIESDSDCKSDDYLNMTKSDVHSVYFLTDDSLSVEANDFTSEMYMCIENYIPKSEIYWKNSKETNGDNEEELGIRKNKTEDIHTRQIIKEEKAEEIIILQVDTEMVGLVHGMIYHYTCYRHKLLQNDTNLCEIHVGQKYYIDWMMGVHFDMILLHHSWIIHLNSTLNMCRHLWLTQTKIIKNVKKSVRSNRVRTFTLLLKAKMEYPLVFGPIMKKARKDEIKAENANESINSELRNCLNYHDQALNDLNSSPTVLEEIKVLQSTDDTNDFMSDSVENCIYKHKSGFGKTRIIPSSENCDEVNMRNSDAQSYLEQERRSIWVPLIENALGKEISKRGSMHQKSKFCEISKRKHRIISERTRNLDLLLENKSLSSIEVVRSRMRGKFHHKCSKLKKLKLVLPVEHKRKIYKEKHKCSLKIDLLSMEMLQNSGQNKVKRQRHLEKNSYKRPYILEINSDEMLTCNDFPSSIENINQSLDTVAFARSLILNSIDDGRKLDELAQEKIRKENKQREGDLLHTWNSLFESFHSPRFIRNLRSLQFIQPEPAILEIFPGHGPGLYQYFQQLESGNVSQQESMKFELVRLASLSSYSGNGSAVNLARHGFYHDPEQGQSATRCYACGLLYTNWEFFDDITEIHQRLSPYCPHLSEIEPSSVNVSSNHVHQHNDHEVTRNDPEVTRNNPEVTRNDQDNTRPSSGQATTTTNTSVTTATNTLQTTHPKGHSMVPEGFPSQPTEDRENSEFSRATPSISGGPRAVRALPRNVQTTTHGMASLTFQTDVNNTAIGARSNESTGEKSTVTSQPSNTESRTPSYTPTIGGAGKLREINQGNGGFSTPGDSVVYGVGDPRLVNVEHPKHQDYRTIQSRSSSFTSLWPSYLDQTPRQMAEAGFFYAGVADFTRCFACGGGLRNWEAGDDPCLEHTRWYPRCEYMNKLKGTRFVEAVTRRQEQHMAEQRRRQQQLQQQRQQVQSQSNNTPPDPLSTPAAATLLEMGYTRERIREAFTAVRRNTGHNSVNAEQALLWILDQDERESQSQANNTSSQSSTTGAIASVSTSASSSASGGSSRASSNSSTATASSTSASGGSSSVSNSTTTASSASASVGSSSTSSTKTTTTVSSASATGTSSQGQKSQGQGGSSKGSGKKNDDKKKDDKGGEKNEGKDSQKKGAEGEQPASGKKKKNGKKKGKGGGANGSLGGAPSVVGGATGGKAEESSNKEEEKLQSQSEVASLDTQSLKEENQKLREMQTCKICMDKPVNMTLLPCGHLVCCENCVPHLRKCPICRKRIEGSVKTYMS